MIFVKNAEKKKFDFWTKSMDQPLTKMSIFWPLLKVQFFYLKMIVCYLKYPKTIFSDIISVKNSDKRKLDFWTKSMDLPFWKMSIFWLFLTFQFCPLKIILFFPQYQKPSFLIWFLLKTPIRKSSIFGQNPWTNPFAKMSIFWPFLKLKFFGLIIIVFYPEYRKTIFFWHNFCEKQPYQKFRFLDKIHGLTPLQKCPFFGPCLNFNFLVLKWLFFI